MKYLKQITPILLGILLVGCNNDKEGWKEEPAEEVKFVSGVSFVEETKPMSRANIAFDTGVELKLIVRDASGQSKFTGDRGTVATTGATSGTANALNCSPILYWNDLGGRDAVLKIIGVHPQDVSVSSDKVTYTLPDDQSGGLKPHELMFANPNNYAYISKGTGAVLNFNHALTKISVTLKPTTDFPLAKLNTAEVSFNNIPLQAEFTITDGTHDTRSSTSAVKPVKAEVKDAGDITEAYSFSILAVPHDINANDLLATVTIDGNVYNVKVNTGHSFGKGNHTNYNVTISKTAVLATASIIDWEGPTNVDLGTRLVGLGDFTVDAGSTGITFAEGAKVNMKLTDKKGGTQNAVFQYTKISDTNFEWTPTTPVYWDDIDEAITAVEALLITKPVDDYLVNSNGEYYFAGSISGQELKWETSPTINLDEANSNKPFFSHPLSKISITVKTSTDADAVDLTAITSVIIPGKVNFSVGDASTGISANATENLTVTGSTNVDNYTCTPGYIYPQAALAELCHVTIGSNIYKVALPSENQTFEAGKHYFYTVTITKAKVGFEASLIDWIEVPGGELPGEL